jgi:hypothetical protein
MKWMLLSVGAGVVGFGMGVVACGSLAESGNDGGTPESQFPRSDSSPPDLDSSEGNDGNSGDDMSNAINNGAGCHKIAGSGSSKVCAYSSATSDAGCTSGATLGTCPSAGLYGCCLVSPTGEGGEADDGGGATTATCYYSPDAGAMGGMSAIDNCQFSGYQGLPYQWITTPPMPASP